MQSPDRGQERARRRAARETLAAYHEQQLTLLLDHVRDGFAQMDAGGLDAFDVDELIHRYQRAARELWKFCGSSGAAWETAARALEFLSDQKELPDWWAASEPRPPRHAT